MNWFSRAKPTEEAADEPQSVRALPAIWYRSPGMYELERRAIFSQRWMLVSHRSRFVEPGDFVQITEAGFNFFLLKDRKGEIRGHHNVCRHRAYPLVEKDSGHMNVLACKYHAWSYGFDGKLAKAPKYQELPSFDKTKNNLFKVHVHVDHLGFIWVNLDASEEPSVSWQEFFGQVDEQPRLKPYNMDEYTFDHAWDMLGDYNWKTLADNYNECYHCPTGHPAVNAVSDLSKYWVETQGNWIKHCNVDKPETDGLGIYSTFYYPNTSMTVSKDFMYIMRCVPISASQTKMEYEVYRHKDAKEEDFTGISEFFKQVLREDKDLCNGAQKNLNSGIFLNGELHPRVEKGPLFFQQITRSLVMSHREREEKKGEDIWPATPKHTASAKTEEDVSFCKGLDCVSSQGQVEGLACGIKRHWSLTPTLNLVVAKPCFQLDADSPKCSNATIIPGNELPIWLDSFQSHHHYHHRHLTSQHASQNPELDESYMQRSLPMTLTPILLLLPTLCSAAAVPSAATKGWVSEPNGRGTFGLICSCVLTLTICVWTALHLNVPAARSAVRSRALERAKWVLYGIFAPEIVVATAAAQYIVARWLKREIQRDADHRHNSDDGSSSAAEDGGLSRHTWDMTQCFYAVMGGFVVDRPVPGEEGGVRRATITPEGIRLLSFIGKLPDIHESQIQDKSKADWMAKSLVCIQAGWMVAQVIGRVIEKMPVSLLEINTCGHVACAVLLYLLWWSKPLDVLDPTVLGDGHDEILALMTACSSMSAVDGVTDIRCFIYPPAGFADGNDAGDVGEESKRGLVTTHLSIGSPGSRDPSRFLGFGVSDLRPSVALTIQEYRKGRMPRTAYEYHIDRTKQTVATECLGTYFTPAYEGLSLRHSNVYCRRVFPDVQKTAASHKPIDPTYLARIAKAADMMWSQCVDRQTQMYHSYYFTTVPTIGVFLGETDYLVPHIVNFPSMTNLGLGQVNVHRDALRSVLAMTAAAYGGLHLSGWVDHFPTRVERTMWIVSSLIIACSGVLLWIFFLARQVWPRFDIFVSGEAPGARLTGFVNQKPWLKRAKLWILGAVLVVFAAARIFLVVEAFLSLRDAPAGLYETPELSNFFPHFQ